MKNPASMTRAELLAYVAALKAMIHTLQLQIRKP